MKRKYVAIVCMLAIIAGAATTVVADSILTTLDYEESEFIPIQGNVTLIFNNSDTGDNDIQQIWRIYDPGENLTVYYMKSKTLAVNSSFENDTKTYVYRDINSGTFYIVRVNYSSLAVPLTIEEAVNRTKAEKDAVIAVKDQEITTLKTEMQTKNATIQQLTDEKNILRSDLDAQIALNQPLHQQIDTLRKQIQTKNNSLIDRSSTINNMGNLLYRANKTMEELANPFCMGYSIYNPEIYSDTPHFYINYISLFIGVTIGIVILVGALIAKGIIKIKKWDNKLKAKSLGSRLVQPPKEDPMLKVHARKDGLPPTLQKLKDQAEKTMSPATPAPTATTPPPAHLAYVDPIDIAIATRRTRTPPELPVTLIEDLVDREFNTLPIVRPEIA